VNYRTIAIRDLFQALLTDKEIPWDSPKLVVWALTSNPGTDSARDRLIGVLKASQFAPLVNARVIQTLAGSGEEAQHAWLETLRDAPDGDYIGLPIVEKAQTPVSVTLAW
jgi:hypothetical protein